MIAGFWTGKKVVVTGADGFIGSHLTERLVEEGAEVRAFAYYNSHGHAGWLEDAPSQVKQDIELYFGDIRDPGRVSDAVQGRDYVFHLASLIAIPYSYHAPDSYVQTNIGGAINILNACRTHGIERLVHTSTSEVYGTAQYVPIDEKHPLQGQSPYSASKIGADMLAQSYFQSFELPVVTARPFNTYGPRQSARAVIPTILCQLYAGAEQLKLGALHPTRDLNFVHDTVSGFLALAQADDAIGRVVNIGSGKEISVSDLVKILIKITDKEAEVVQDQQRLRPDKSEVDRLLCDTSLLKVITDWESAYTLEQGLTLTADWVKSHPEHFKPDSYSI